MKFSFQAEALDLTTMNPTNAQRASETTDIFNRLPFIRSIPDQNTRNQILIAVLSHLIPLSEHNLSVGPSLTEKITFIATNYPTPVILEDGWMLAGADRKRVLFQDGAEIDDELPVKNVQSVDVLTRPEKEKRSRSELERKIMLAKNYLPARVAKKMVRIVRAAGAEPVGMHRSHERLQVD